MKTTFQYKSVHLIAISINLISAVIFIIADEFSFMPPLNYIALVYGVLVYVKTFHNEYYSLQKQKLKDIYRIIRAKECIAIITLNQEELEAKIDNERYNVKLNVSNYNVKTYPFFIILKRIADILTFEDMVMLKAEYQFEQDELLNKRAREEIKKEKNR